MSNYVTTNVDELPPADLTIYDSVNLRRYAMMKNRPGRHLTFESVQGVQAKRVTL